MFTSLLGICSDLLDIKGKSTYHSLPSALKVSHIGCEAVYELCVATLWISDCVIKQLC